MSLKTLGYSLIIAVICLVLFCIYSVGKSAGMGAVQKKWDEQVKLDKERIATLKEEIRSQEHEHQIETTRITDELAQAKQKHTEELAAQQRYFDSRLLNSDKRANYYQRQAQGSAAERNDLASHAAQLDRSLEEGRQLVRELGETLRLREQELISLGQQILADRKLFDDGTEHGTD